jgi:hypothetical protein
MKDMVIDGPALCGKSKSDCLRLIAETASSCGLAVCSASRSYLLRWGLEV